MTINQLTYFVAAVENKSFLEAGEAVNLSQSSLSKSLQRLEEELGVKLFDRSKRSCALTEEGQVLYQGALKILADYKDTMLELKHVSSSLHGTIRLATLPILAQYNLTGLLKEFTSENKGVELLIDEMEDLNIVQELDNGTCDLAITRKECLNKDNYKFYQLATDELVLITSLSHPLSSKTEISLRELEHEKFILMNKHISIYSLCIDACIANGFTPNVLRTARIESILSAVSENEAVSLLMKKNLSVFLHENVAVIPLNEKILSTIVLAMNKNRRPSLNVQAFIDKLSKIISNFDKV